MTPLPCRVPAVLWKGPTAGLRVASSHGAADMQAEGLTGLNPLLWERLAQAYAAAQEHRELLRSRVGG